MFSFAMIRLAIRVAQSLRERHVLRRIRLETTPTAGVLSLKASASKKVARDSFPVGYDGTRPLSKKFLQTEPERIGVSRLLAFPESLPVLRKPQIPWI